MIPDCIELTQELVRFPSLNPPGEEKPCIGYLEALLSAGGMDVSTYEFASGRPSLVATVAGSGSEKPLCFTGHVDVVPLGTEPWSASPFGGDIVDGKLFGRGASDMKAGVAAFVAATLAEIRGEGELRRGLTLIITAGEETGCEGAFHLGRIGALDRAEMLVVAEPTSNKPIFAHKGCFRVVVSAPGVTAHSSMPELGDNAINKVAKWIDLLSAHRLNAPPHPILGESSAAVTTVVGGLNINSVPDSARFTVDFRTLPEQAHPHLLAEVQALFGPEASIRTISDLKGFSTDPDEPALQPLLDILAERTGHRPSAAGAPYFTDASALVPALNDVPTVVLGPGEPEQAHRTDEFCFVHRIEEAFDIYRELIGRLCR